MTSRFFEIGSLKYSGGEIPKAYHCDACKAHGVKLWRNYQTFLEKQRLLCLKCTLTDQGKDAVGISMHNIGWMVAAVPVEGDDTFWGYTSVPPEGVAWWDKLPDAKQGG